MSVLDYLIRMGYSSEWSIGFIEGVLGRSIRNEGGIVPRLSIREEEKISLVIFALEAGALDVNNLDFKDLLSFGEWILQKQEILG